MTILQTLAYWITQDKVLILSKFWHISNQISQLVFSVHLWASSAGYRGTVWRVAQPSENTICCSGPIHRPVAQCVLPYPQTIFSQQTLPDPYWQREQQKEESSTVSKIRLTLYCFCPEFSMWSSSKNSWFIDSVFFYYGKHTLAL